MINYINTVKSIDCVIGPLLLNIFPKVTPPKKIKSLERILIIRPGGMGDAILLLPILKAISIKFNHLNIDILCEERNQEVFKSVSFVNRLFSYKNPMDLLSLFKNKYDIIVDTEQSHILTAIITRILHAKCKSGFRTNGRQKMYNISIPYNHNTYEAESFWDLVSDTLNLKETFSWNFPYFTNSALTIKSKIYLPEKYICLFPGATVAERLWPEEKWANVIDHLSSLGWNCVLLGGRKEIPQCDSIIAKCKSKMITNACSKLTIHETTGLLKNSTLLISTDSGILHLGVLSNIPTISLFGSGISAKWGPRGDQHFIINKRLGCSPCTKFGTTPPCPNEYKCMMQINSSEIISVIEDFF